MLRVRRHEIKYRLSRGEAAILKARLEPLLAKDQYSKGGPYRVRSLYFDNKADSGFYDRLEGMEKRKKYRLRIYDFAAPTVKMECKEKCGDMISKESGWMRAEDAAALACGEVEVLLPYTDAVFRKIYYDFKKDRYAPAVIVEYMREAFALDYNHIRVTFDSQVKKSRWVGGWRDPEAPLVPVLKNDFVILEIKYNHFFPGWLTGLLNPSRFEREAISKYYLSRTF